MTPIRWLGVLLLMMGLGAVLQRCYWVSLCEGDGHGFRSAGKSYSCLPIREGHP